MALNPINRLQILKEAKRLLTGRRSQVAQDQADLVALAPADMDVQAAGLYTPMLTAFDAAIARVDAAIAAVNITNADKAAFADFAINSAKS